MPELNWIGKSAVVKHHKEAASEREKNDIGKLWASRSDNCRFVMAIDRNWQSKTPSITKFW